MIITKCDWCKKFIEDDVYSLEMRNVSKIISFSDAKFDICEDCYMKLCKKLNNEEEEDAT